MTWTPWHDRRVHAAAGVVLIGSALLLRSVIVALAEPAIEAALPLAFVTDTAAPPTVARAPIGQLAALAPFSASRTPAPANAPAIGEPPPPIALVGTLAGAADPAAICRLGAAPARILHVGESLGGWRLLQVAPGRVVFIDEAGVRHELRLSPVGK